MSNALAIATLRTAYAEGRLTPEAVISEVYARITARGLSPIWISLVSQDRALAKLALAPRGPLWGVPFAVKDNIDVAGMPTTCACPEFAYTPECSARVVERLEAAGAILVGKTNLDQFATGLVGTRSPYGICSSVFDPEYISGGSSSGSAVAVASGLVSFALGTDTAGSGRVPAAFNNIVGLKSSKGLVSTRGVFPASRSLDVVSVFAATVGDAQAVLDAMAGFDSEDSYSRRAPRSMAPEAMPANFRFGVPATLEFFGDGAAERLFFETVTRLESLGGARVEIDYAPFREAAALLYGVRLAERFAAFGAFARDHPDAMDETVGRIIAEGDKLDGVAAFKGLHRLAELVRAAEPEWAKMDVFLLPTTATIYRRDEVRADPIRLNANLGLYTNFVNLMDLSALAIPAGFRPNGLPFGVTLVGRAFEDGKLVTLGDQLHRALPGATMGATGEPLALSAGIAFTTNNEILSRDAVPRPLLTSSARGEGPVEISSTGSPSSNGKGSMVEIAVVGAHLSGQPLNRQLTERNARLLRTTRTANGYRLYALPGPDPPKPGLVYDGAGAGNLEVEVWEMDAAAFGSFVALVPSPLAIGTLTLAEGDRVKGFLCESYAIQDAEDITQHGGWRAWLRNR